VYRAGLATRSISRWVRGRLHDHRSDVGIDGHRTQAPPRFVRPSEFRQQLKRLQPQVRVRVGPRSQIGDLFNGLMTQFRRERRADAFGQRLIEGWSAARIPRYALDPGHVGIVRLFPLVLVRHYDEQSVLDSGRDHRRRAPKLTSGH